MRVGPQHPRPGDRPRLVAGPLAGVARSTLRGAAKLACLIPRLALRRERNGLLLTERGDAGVVVGQELLIVGERELSIVDRDVATPRSHLGTQVQQLVGA